MSIAALRTGEEEMASEFVCHLRFDARKHISAYGRIMHVCANGYAANPLDNVECERIAHCVCHSMSELGDKSGKNVGYQYIDPE